MTDNQKLLRRLVEKRSKHRQRVAELAAIDDLSDEQRAEMDQIEAETPDLERKLRATQRLVDDEQGAQIVDGSDGPDSEMRERIELRSKASLGRILAARMQNRLPSGAEAELCAAAGCELGNIPVELFEAGRTEDRAVSPSPSTVGVNFARIEPALFAESVAPRIGIDMPSVASGTYASGTISTSLTAGMKAAGGDTEATAAAITVTSATPARLSGRLDVRIEDIAQIGNESFEMRLRENLSLVMADQLDNQILNGTGASNQISGIFNQLAAVPTAPTAVADFDYFASEAARLVDGKWARTLRDVTMVVGDVTYQRACVAFQTAGATYKGELSAQKYAESTVAAFFTNSRMPPEASDIQDGIAYRGARMMRTAELPIWNSIGIDDVYTGAPTGERRFILHMLIGNRVILCQPDAYRRTAYKLA